MKVRIKKAALTAMTTTRIHSETAQNPDHRREVLRLSVENSFTSLHVHSCPDNRTGWPARCQSWASAQRGDEFFDPLVPTLERVLAEDGPLGLVVEFEVDPIHRVVPLVQFGGADELAP